MKKSYIIIVVLVLCVQLNIGTIAANYDTEEVFENHDAIMLVISAEDGEILDANHAALDFYGYSYEEIVGMKISDINTLTEAEVKVEMERALKHERNQYLFKHQLKSGEVRHVEVYSSPTVLEDGTDALFSIIHDVTNRIEAEEATKLQGRITTGIGVLFLIVLLSATIIQFRTRRKEKKLIDSRLEAIHKIEYLSFHDQLTGLYNRRFFEEELDRLDVNRNLPLSIGVLDINGLKLTNDAFGHKKGDELLIHIAEKIKEVCREDDILARTGGDEFIIILPRTDAEEAEHFIKRLRKNIEENQLDYIVASASAGIATKNFLDEHINDVFKKAEEEMYHTKLVESQDMRNRTIENIIKILNNARIMEVDHLDNVSKIAGKIAEIMNLDDEDIEEVAIAGQIHDIGKIAVSNKYLDKNGPLMPDEYEDLRRHSEIGYHILKHTDKYAKYAEYALNHHENYDGSGYPRGIKGSNLSVKNHILSVADALESMSSERKYRRKKTMDQIKHEFARCSGTQFSPEVIKICASYGWERLLREVYEDH